MKQSFIKNDSINEQAVMILQEAEMGIFSKIVKELELEDTVNAYKDELKKAVTQELEKAEEADRRTLSEIEKRRTGRYTAVSQYFGSRFNNEWKVFDADGNYCYLVSTDIGSEATVCHASVYDMRNE